MAAKTEKSEHAKAPAVVRVIEMVGVSDKSWSDAAQVVVARASETVRNITGLDILKSSAVVKNGKIVEYRVDVKLAFVVEPTFRWSSVKYWRISCGGATPRAPRLLPADVLRQVSSGPRCEAVKKLRKVSET